MNYSLSLVDMFLASGLILVWVTILLGLKAISSRDSEKEALKKENRELRKQLREEVERVKQYYEQLLKEAAVKNAVMVSLYNAWRSGELKKCYDSGGDIKILMDGTVICDKGKQSYVIAGVQG